jgi:glutamyl-tRNA synthetase
MHLGNLRTALYTYLLAKKNGGSFVLRIEDTDRERFVSGATETIYNTLRYCGLDWDEGPDKGGKFGPYVQSERQGLYKKYAEQLVANGGAYRCFCTTERMNELHRQQKANGIALSYDRHCRDLTADETAKLLEEGAPYVIRQKVPLEGTTTFKDEIYGEITVPNADLDDQILLKSDGMPTYNFANVIDDHLMEITHVVRGCEYLSSAPKYELLYKSFGWTPPVYIHVQQIMRDETHKLSKRDGDAYFEDFLKKGYLAEVIINYIALLGWSPGGENEIFSLLELIEAFDISGLSKSPAIFDEVKMRAINGIYIRTLTPEEFQGYAEPVVREASRKAAAECVDFDVLCKALQPRTEILNDIIELVDFIDETLPYDAEWFVNKKMKTTKESSLIALKTSLPYLEQMDKNNFTLERVQAQLSKAIAELNVKNGSVLWPIRLALSGKMSTPGGGAELCAIVGKAQAIKRIEQAILKLEEAIQKDD